MKQKLRSSCDEERGENLDRKEETKERKEKKRLKKKAAAVGLIQRCLPSLNPLFLDPGHEGELGAG